MERDERSEALSNAAAEKLLADIIEIAEDALADASGEGEGVRAEAYADAIERIRGKFPRRNVLDMPGDFRLVRFHAGDTTTFVGTRKDKEGNGGMLIEGRCVRIDEEVCSLSVTVNGKDDSAGHVFGGLHRAESVLVGALHGLCAYKRDNRAHRAARKEVR